MDDFAAMDRYQLVSEIIRLREQNRKLQADVDRLNEQYAVSHMLAELQDP